MTAQEQMAHQLRLLAECIDDGSIRTEPELRVALAELNGACAREARRNPEPEAASYA